jgi:hypothetical protein
MCSVGFGARGESLCCAEPLRWGWCGGAQVPTAIATSIVNIIAIGYKDRWGRRAAHTKAEVVTRRYPPSARGPHC